MKNYFLVISILMIFVLIGCDAYENVPGKTERVLAKRPYAFFSRNSGGEVFTTPLKTGKRNHGDGPAIGYDFDLSIQNSSIRINVKTLDNINQPMTVNLSWSMIEGKTLLAALNFLPVDKLVERDGDKYSGAQGDNSTKILVVPVQEIYVRYIEGIFDMVSRDIVDNYSNKDITIDLRDQIKANLIARLTDVKYPSFVLGENNLSVFNPDKLISILDVVEINGVSITDLKNPEVIDEKIQEIDSKKGELSALNDKVRQAEIERSDKIDLSRTNRAIALNIEKTLKENPNLPTFKRLTELKEIVSMEKNGKESRNTKFILVPKGTNRESVLRLAD